MIGHNTFLDGTSVSSSEGGIQLVDLYGTSAGTSADISSNMQSPTVIGIYSIDGRRLTSMQPGINIVRYSNGTCAKIMK